MCALCALCASCRDSAFVRSWYAPGLPCDLPIAPQDTVNIASRMESQGVPKATQVTEAVQLILKDSFVFQTRGPMNLKGKGMLFTFLHFPPHRRNSSSVDVSQSGRPGDTRASADSMTRFPSSTKRPEDARPSVDSMTRFPCSTGLASTAAFPGTSLQERFPQASALGETASMIGNYDAMTNATHMPTGGSFSASDDIPTHVASSLWLMQEGARSPRGINSTSAEHLFPSRMGSLREPLTVAHQRLGAGTTTASSVEQLLGDPPDEQPLTAIHPLRSDSSILLRTARVVGTGTTVVGGSVQTVAASASRGAGNAQYRPGSPYSLGGPHGAGSPRNTSAWEDGSGRSDGASSSGPAFPGPGTIGDGASWSRASQGRGNPQSIMRDLSKLSTCPSTNSTVNSSTNRVSLDSPPAHVFMRKKEKSQSCGELLMTAKNVRAKQGFGPSQKVCTQELPLGPAPQYDIHGSCAISSGGGNREAVHKGTSNRVLLP